MKVLFVALFISFSFSGTTQNLNSFFELLKKSDTRSISELLAPKVQYCFDDQIDVADKIVALKALKAFLERNPPKAVTPMHKGNSKGEDSSFSIAILETANGKKYRVYVYAEFKSGATSVKEIRIDKQ